MENMTLRELCDTLNISRRVVQGYEKASLVVPSGKNKRGYLLYNEKTLERIRCIRFYQQLGFKIKEIKFLMDLTPEELKERLEQQVKMLKEQKLQLDDLIEQAEALINTIELKNI